MSVLSCPPQSLPSISTTPLHLVLSVSLSVTPLANLLLCKVLKVLKKNHWQGRVSKKKQLCVIFMALVPKVKLLFMKIDTSFPLSLAN